MSWLLIVHISAGSLALLTFWLPLVTLKGGMLHRRIGWVFVAAMAVVSLTAWLMCALRFHETDNPHERASALFLAYVGLLSATSSWGGLRALRFKQRTEPHRHPLDIAIPLLLLASASGVFVYGYQLDMVLLMVFAPIGIVVACGELGYWLRQPRERQHWWYQHMSGMIGTCIATLTAFLVVNLVYFARQNPFLAVWAWLLPSAIGLPGMMYWQRVYRRKFEKAASAERT